MNYANEKDKNNYAIFHPDMHEAAMSRLKLETDLRWAIKRNELRVVYQPIFSLEKEDLTGFEALVRWQHPTQGFIFPGEFLPLAEETGLVSLIDWWVLMEACQQLSTWQKQWQGEQPLTMSVNMSGHLLAQTNLAERLKTLLLENHIQPQSLKLEVTEQFVMEDQGTALELLQQLKDLGVQLSIDDFGTGLFCLQRLHQLPIDTLKVDRSFVSQMAEDPESLTAVQTIITLAHGLRMDVVAEGIETTEQLSQVRSLQGEYGQGYWFSKPLDSCKASELIQREFEVSSIS